MNFLIELPSCGVNNRLHVPEGYEVNPFTEKDSDRLPVYSPAGYDGFPIADSEGKELIPFELSFPKKIRKIIRERADNKCEITGLPLLLDEKSKLPAEIMHIIHPGLAQLYGKDPSIYQNDPENGLLVVPPVHLNHHELFGLLELGLNKQQNDLSLQALHFRVEAFSKEFPFYMAAIDPDKVKRKLVRRIKKLCKFMPYNESYH